MMAIGDIKTEKERGRVGEGETGRATAGEQGCKGAEEQGCRGAGEQASRGAEEQGCRGAGEWAGECVVKVFNVAPLIFAPRVQFAQKIASVKLDGKPWHYFDEDMVFLPNRPGTYRVEVAYGEPTVPHLTRTYGVLGSSHWDGKTLTMEFELPPWANRLYPGLKLTGAVKTEGREVTSVKKASVIYRVEKGVVIEYLPGEVVVDLA